MAGLMVLASGGWWLFQVRRRLPGEVEVFHRGRRIAQLPLASFGKHRVTFGKQGDLRLLDMEAAIAGQFCFAQDTQSTTLVVELFGKEGDDSTLDQFPIHHGEEVVLDDGYRLRYVYELESLNIQEGGRRYA